MREVTFDHDFIEHATSVIATDRKIIAQISSEDNNFTPDAHGKQSLLGISTICVGPANCDSRRNVAGFYASRVLGLLSGSGSTFLPRQLQSDGTHHLSEVILQLGRSALAPFVFTSQGRDDQIGKMIGIFCARGWHKPLFCIRLHPYYNRQYAA